MSPAASLGPQRPTAPVPLRSAGLLLQALSGRSADSARVATLPPAQGLLNEVEIGTDTHATPGRPVLTDSALLLPADLAPPLQRAAVAHAAAHWRFSLPHHPAAGLKPMALAVIGCLEDARVEHLLVQRFPGTRQWFMQALRVHQAVGLGFADLLGRLSRALWDDDWTDPNPWVGRARMRVAGLVAQSGWHDAIALRHLGGILANELGQMRVRMAPDHAEPSAYRDDHSWLWQHEATHSQALSLDASDTRTDAGGQASEATAAPAPEAHLSWHPEWHHRIGHLKPRWTTVMEYGLSPDFQTSEAIRYSSLINQRRPKMARRQPDGHALDLDACVRLRSAQASPHNASQRKQASPCDARVFLRHLPQPQAFSVLVLLDLSTSMNDSLPGLPSSPTLLALAKGASLSLLRTAQALGGTAALHGFHANTRHAVHYERLVDFGAALDTATLARIQAAQARHSTRLGSALRHATQHLLARSEVRRLLLVLSDGAPSDVDVFDPQHLVEDARHAVQAARRAGVEVMSLSAHRATVSAPGQSNPPDDHAAIARIFGRQAHTLGSLQGLQRMPRRLQAMLVQALGTA